MKKNVVVIFGGDSSEHDVSCLSATTVIKNMDTEKYNVILVGITKEGKWLLVDSVKDIEDGSWREGEVKAFISPDTTTRSLVILAEGTYKLQKVDVIFPVLHGMNGEDGTVQGLFELSKIPYVGCGVLASAVSMDKVYTKIIVDHIGIDQAKFVHVRESDFEHLEEAMDRVEKEIPYREIPDFPVSTVQGHDGRFLLGWIGKVPVVVMKGRVHYYEGYSMEEVVLPVRLMKKIGIEILFLTNASGGINPEFAAGDFMMIRDQIASFVPSPLIGQNIEKLGTRFPDMTHIYDEELQDMIRQSAKHLEIDLKEGVYIQLAGPNFESPAEIRMCKAIGADAVGMSTACEAIAAKHMGMKVLGISCISNLASGISSIPLSHAEVQETADAVAPKFKALVTETIKAIGAQQN